MKHRIHLVAAITATLCIGTFFISSILVELFGSGESISMVKSLIVFPGLFILIPAIAATGGTGFLIAKHRTGRLVEKKKRRMPFIGLNGLFILLPAAIVQSLGWQRPVRYPFLPASRNRARCRSNQSNVNGLKHSRWFKNDRQTQSKKTAYTDKWS